MAHEVGVKAQVGSVAGRDEYGVVWGGGGALCDYMEGR